MIKQIQEKNQQKQNELELQKEKKLLERALLKKEILEQALLNKERKQSDQKEEVFSATNISKKSNIFRIKKQPSHPDLLVDKKDTQNMTQNKEICSENDIGFKYTKEKMMKIYENKITLPSLVKKAPNIENKENDEEIIDEKNAEKQKLRNYFRSRYASFINSLKYDFKLKKINEENEKKRKESMLSKIREEMGINNITSKVMEPTNAFKAKITTKNEKRRSLSEDNGLL